MNGPTKNMYPTFPNPAGIGSCRGYEAPAKQQPEPQDLGVDFMPPADGMPQDLDVINPWELMRGGQ